MGSWLPAASGGPGAQEGAAPRGAPEKPRRTPPRPPRTRRVCAELAAVRYRGSQPRGPRPRAPPRPAPGPAHRLRPAPSERAGSGGLAAPGAARASALSRGRVGEPAPLKPLSSFLGVALVRACPPGAGLGAGVGSFSKTYALFLRGGKRGQRAVDHF